MSTLVIAQTLYAGVQLSATPEDATTTNIVITFVSSVFDSLGSLEKSFTASAGIPGSFQLTDADLTTLFGADNLPSMKAGGLSPALSMSAQQFGADGVEVEEAQTAINGATGLNQLYYKHFAHPLAPVEVSVYPSNNKLTIFATVYSKNDVEDKIKLIVHKTSTIGLGEITNSDVTGIPLTNVDGVRTYSFEADNLDNESSYEIFARFANIGENSVIQYGPANVAAFAGVPNTAPGMVSNVQVATALDGLVFDPTNAATVNADWLKTETDLTRIVTSYKLYVTKSDGTKSLEVAQPSALTAENGDIVTLVPASIPRAWFTNNVIEINIAIKEYYKDGTSRLGNLVIDKNVFQMIMPTLSDVIIDSVTASGGQSIRVNATAPGAGVHTISHTFNGISQIGNGTTIRTYNEINGSLNKDIVFTHNVVDANDNSLVPYFVTSSATLYAFKTPSSPNVPTISISGFNADPVLSFIKTLSQSNNGYTIESYNVVVEYVAPVGNGVASYGSPYSENFLYTDDDEALGNPITATSNNQDAPYIAGNYKVTVSSVFSTTDIPALYSSVAVPSVATSSLTAVRWWTRPTIASINVDGANMRITGNNGGAIYSNNSITSIGFTGTSDDSTLSKITNAMPTASLGVADTTRTALGLFDFSILLAHSADLVDLAGDYLDGLGFVDPDNAPSAISVAVFNTDAIANFANQTEIGSKIAGLPSLRDAVTSAQDELDNNNEYLVLLKDTQSTAQQTYDDALDEMTNPVNLAQIVAVAVADDGAAASTKSTADAALAIPRDEDGEVTGLSLEGTFNAAKDSTSLAQTEKDNADDAVTGDNSNDNLVRQSNAIQALADAVAAQATADTAYSNALQDQIAAGVALSNANDALSNANNAFSTANAPKNIAFIARTAANQAVINSENQIESDKGVLLTAQTAPRCDYRSWW